MTKTLSATALKDLSEAEFITDKARHYLNSGKLEVAEALFSQAINKRRDAVGAEETGVAELLDQLGEIKCELGKYDEAHQCFDTALKSQEKNYYPQHYKLGPVLLHQATCFIKQGKFEAALDPCNKAFEIFGKTLSGEHRLTLEATYKLATIYKQIGKADEGLKIITKVKKNVDTPLGPMEEFSFLEGLLQEELGKPDLADKAFQDALAGFRQRRSFRRLAQGLARYAEFLKKQGKNDEAEKLLRQSEQYDAVKDSLSRSDDIFPSTLLRA